MRRLLILTVPLLVFPLYAGELQNAARDAKSLATAPLHWHRAEWKRFGEGAAAVAVVFAADHKLLNAAQRNRSSATDSFSRVVTPFGARRGVWISGAMFAGGALVHDRVLESAGRDSLEAEMWASGVVTALLKRAVGRERPNGADRRSFPSGHATNAFAAATAIAAHYDNWVVPTLAYTIATGVAFSRVNDRVHFPSDVLAGALIGRAVARGVVARHMMVVPAKRGFMFVVR